MLLWLKPVVLDCPLRLLESKSTHCSFFDHPSQAAARSLATKLTDAGLHTTFLLVTALDLVMPEVTLVLLGCEVNILALLKHIVASIHPFL